MLRSPFLYPNDGTPMWGAGRVAQSRVWSKVYLVDLTPRPLSLLKGRNELSSGISDPRELRHSTEYEIKHLVDLCGPRTTQR